MIAVQLLVGQIGSSSKRQKALNRVLTETELPGTGWKKIGERSWRTGLAKPLSGTSRRALMAGGFNVLRHFRSRELQKWLFIQIWTCSSPEDASVLAPRLPAARMLPRPGVNVTPREFLQVVGGAELENSRAWQVRTSRGELKGTQRSISGRSENVAFLVSGTVHVPDEWPWDELGAIATAQATKIRIE